MKARPLHDRDEIAEHAPRLVRVLFEQLGERLRIVGAEGRTRYCPTCGPRTRAAVVVNLTSGRWIDHAHGCKGDVFALVAAQAGLDVRRDFPRVLELAAELAGVAPSRANEAERSHRRAEMERRRVARVALDRVAKGEARERAVAVASAAWSRLELRSEIGEVYLASRGVAGAIGACRFTAAGEVAIALHTADGRPVNVVRRRRPGVEPKVLGLAGCPTAGTFVDALPAIVHGRDVVLVEGMFDALTAREVWPDAVVLGAHGAGNLERIGAAASRRVKLAGARLLLVPHDDDAGRKGMIGAGRAALAAGLRLDRELVVVDIPGKDLNVAHCAGWKP